MYPIAAFSAGLMTLAALVSPVASVPANPQYRGTDNANVTGILAKRFDNAQLSFYNVGLGICGQRNVPSDFQFTSQDCFKKIVITANGKCTQATIVDECPTCPTGGLDLSTGLFQFFAPLSAGLISGDWDFV